MRSGASDTVIERVRDIRSHLVPASKTAEGKDLSFDFPGALCSCCGATNVTIKKGNVNNLIALHCPEDGCNAYTVCKPCVDTYGLSFNAVALANEIYLEGGQKHRFRNLPALTTGGGTDAELTQRAKARHAALLDVFKSAAAEQYPEDHLRQLRSDARKQNQERSPYAYLTRYHYLSISFLS